MKAMTTMLLAAVAVLAIGAAAASANATQDASRAAPASLPQCVEDRKASTAQQPPPSRSYSTPSQMHDAGQNNGLNGGGG